jgi:hypothetical protein
MQPGDACFYGVTQRQYSLFDEVKKSGRTWYYCDNGYAPCMVRKDNGRRLELFRLTVKAAQITGIGEGDPERRDLYMPEILPWRKSGREILVCVQSEWHHRLWGSPRDRWLQKVVTEIRKYSDKPIIVRDKPLRNRKEIPFERALETAHAVVTFNSRVAVEAILAGVPAYVSVPCAASFVAMDSLEQIDNPPRPSGRAEWAAYLAANQWTADELQTGKAWSDLWAMATP